MKFVVYWFNKRLKWQECDSLKKAESLQRNLYKSGIWEVNIAEKKEQIKSRWEIIAE